MPIKIIGAGFPRTGTTTLKRSLEILGYSKTYHMKELLVNPDKLDYWLKLEETAQIGIIFMKDIWQPLIFRVIHGMLNT